MDKKEVDTTRRVPADLRIQRRKDFVRIAGESRYYNGGPQESSNYRYLMHKRVIKEDGEYKKVGKARNIFAEELTSMNKGYPKGFKDYDTYDPKYNRAYEKRNRK